VKLINVEETKEKLGEKLLFLILVGLDQHINIRESVAWQLFEKNNEYIK